jgi:D-glycero-D-manno-heptose 1,7-bisphosphate phosphatase
MIKVAFLDRDGVINLDEGFTHKIDQFEFLEGTITALRKLKVFDYSIIIVTNQSGIGRGLYSETDYQKLSDWIRRVLEKRGITKHDI